MNRDNLQRMADYIRTIPQDMFDMSQYRKSYPATTRECNSVGCVIGHCTVLDSKELPLLVQTGKAIDFMQWSEEFTELECGEAEWEWCFGSGWVDVDNTPIGSALRIEWLLNHGLPTTWEDQQNGDVPLCYMQ